VTGSKGGHGTIRGQREISTARLQLLNPLYPISPRPLDPLYQPHYSK